jgi:methylated-DNA-[protein]-cysteine S-methyltransferase
MMHGSAGPGSLISEAIETPIGALVVVEDEAGALNMVEFADCLSRIDRCLRRLALGGCELKTGGISETARDAFAAFFGGEVAALYELPVRLGGTPFQNEVWSALRRIRPGETLGYGAFAERLGRPQSARAVGHANGANPLSIVVPCHRLVGADGALTAYGGGIERKRWLLDHEARHAPALSINRRTPPRPVAGPA